jgi:hypothetical protein
MASLHFLSWKGVVALFALIFAAAAIAGCTNNNTTGNIIAEPRQQPQEQGYEQPAQETGITTELASVLANPSLFIGKVIETEGIVGPYEYTQKEHSGLKYAFMENGKTLPILLNDPHGNLAVSKMARTYRIRGVVSSMELCRCEFRHVDVSGHCVAWFQYMNTDWKDTNGFWDKVSDCTIASQPIACERTTIDGVKETGLYAKEYRCAAGTRKEVIYIASDAPEHML